MTDEITLTTSKAEFHIGPGTAREIADELEVVLSGKVIKELSGTVVFEEQDVPVYPERFIRLDLTPEEFVALKSLTKIDQRVRAVIKILQGLWGLMQDPEMLSAVSHLANVLGEIDGGDDGPPWTPFSPDGIDDPGPPWGRLPNS
jgi:hypothetical protein